MADREFLADLVTNAGTVLRQRFGRTVSFAEKARYDLVSDADVEVEALIVSGIRAAFPDDAILSEEMGHSGPATARRWIVDPLDGTTNFVFGVPHIAVSVAIEERGAITHGAVYNPISGELYLADATGAARNGAPIACSNTSDLRHGLVAFGLSMIPANVERMLSEWRSVCEVERKGLALLAPALNICAVACGRTDAFIDFGSTVTGHAAAAFILQRAGGAVTNYDGAEWDHHADGIIATNGRLDRALTAHRRR